MGKLVVEESIVVDASKPGVWKVFRDLERWPKWNPVCPEAKYVSGEPWAKGSVFQFFLITGKRKNRFKPIIVESKPEDKVTWLVDYCILLNLKQLIKKKPKSPAMRSSLVCCCH